MKVDNNLLRLHLFVWSISFSVKHSTITSPSFFFINTRLYENLQILRKINALLPIKNQPTKQSIVRYMQYDSLEIRIVENELHIPIMLMQYSSILQIFLNKTMYSLAIRERRPWGHHSPSSTILGATFKAAKQSGIIERDARNTNRAFVHSLDFPRVKR